MEKFRFRAEGAKVLGSAGYFVDHEENLNLQYTGLYQGGNIVALLVTEYDEESMARLFKLGDTIVRACNAHEQLVAALNKIASGENFEAALVAQKALDAAGLRPGA